ncbi:FAD-binding oxidoreductase [Nordella sp. HKS 07]|nr:FAD-binding oxidoreductase [Nordella sp. HKS 07]
MHIVVVGSGIVGSSVAYECAKAGARVTIFDSGRLAGGASAVSFAWTNATTKTPRSYFALNVAGMRAHLELKRDFGDVPWFVQTGSLEWRTTAPGLSQQREEFKQLQEWGYAVEWIDENDLARIEPDIDVSAVGGAPVAYYPEEGWVDPVLYSASLLRKASARWNTIVRLNQPVAAVETHNGQVKGVRTAPGELVAADVVINCTGSFSDRALGSVPAVPMASTIGVLAFTLPMGLTLRRQFHADDLDVRPDGAGRLMIHKVSVDQTLSEAKQLQPGGDEATTLLEAARRVVPALNSGSIEAIRTTVRPVPRDGYTCAGPMPDVAGYYAVVTHSGVTLAPFLGRAMADEIIRGKMRQELETFRPARFFAPDSGFGRRKAANAVPA